jgi:rubrerythrin
VKSEERLKAIDLALNNEMREHQFYLKHAERTRNHIGKAVFKRIADDELEHYKRLQELHKKWVKQERWPETVPLKVKDTVVKDVLLDAIRAVEKKPETDSDDLVAIRTAIDFEEKGVAYYENLRNMVSDPKEKQFFFLLSQIEKEHALSLRDAEEYLTDPESWFLKKERHSLDGM